MKQSRSIIWLVMFIALSCSEAPKVTTTSPEALKSYNEGLHQFENFYYTEAKNSFEQALRLDSNFAMAYARLAMLHAQTRSEAEASAAIAKALRQSSGASRREQLFIRLFDHLIHYRNAEAAVVADSLITQYPKDAEPYVLRGNLSELNKRFDDALKMFERAVKTDTGYAPAAMSLGYAYSARGDFGRAIREMERYIRLSPEAADPRASFADILFRAGRYDEALDQYLQSLERKPDYWYSVNRIGDIYLTLGRLNDAEKQFEMGLTMMIINDQVRATHLAMQALLQSKRGNYGETIRLSEQSLALDTTNLRAAFIRVMAQSRLKYFNEAERNINSLRAEIDRRNLGESQLMLEFYLLRANYFEHRGLLEEAISACDSAMEFGSELTRAVVYQQLAEIFLKQGSYESALDALEEALRYNSNSPDALLTLTKVYKAAGDKQMTNEIGSRLRELWKEADKDFRPLTELKQLLLKISNPRISNS